MKAFLEHLGGEPMRHQGFKGLFEGSCQGESLPKIKFSVLVLLKWGVDNNKSSSGDECFSTCDCTALSHG